MVEYFADDRYVLKEMTKPEWQQFLEFAPHYFNYVTNCHQKKLPSLLGKWFFISNATQWTHTYHDDVCLILLLIIDIYIVQCHALHKIWLRNDSWLTHNFALTYIRYWHIINYNNDVNLTSLYISPTIQIITLTSVTGW